MSRWIHPPQTLVLTAVFAVQTLGALWGCTGGAPQREPAGSSSSGGGTQGDGGAGGGGSSGGTGQGDAGAQDLCTVACAHVYQDCGMAFRSQSGAPVPQADCVAGCQGGALNGAESCLSTAACTGAALNACLSGGGTSSTSSSTGGTGTTSSSGGTTPGWLPEETRVLELVNAQRAAGATCGGQAYGPAPALTADDALHASARGHAQDMAQNNYFSHTSQDGRSFSDRIFAAGYNGGPPLAENIAAGNATAESTVSQWMASTGHCQNIMNPSLRRLGVGHAYNQQATYGHYWVQNFGGP